LHKLFYQLCQLTLDNYHSFHIHTIHKLTISQAFNTVKLMEIPHQIQLYILTNQNMALHGIQWSLSKDMSMDTVAYQPTKMWELMMIGPHFTVLVVQALRNGL
jgi:hypothetical protein